MPFTFSHPAAVIPLRRFCPRLLDFPALVIGSLAPDFGYYFQLWNLAAQAHTILGAATLCVPSGFVFVLLYYFLANDFAQLLPAPTRALIDRSIRSRQTKATTFVISVIVSIILGAWTHDIWDSFTHEHGWLVLHCPPLSNVLFTFGSYTLYLYKLLQYVSSLVGLLVIILVYRQRQKSVETLSISESSISSNNLFMIWVVLLVAPLVPAGLEFYSDSTQLNGQISTLQSNGFHALLTYVDYFCLIALVATIIVRVRRRVRSKRKTIQ